MTRAAIATLLAIALAACTTSTAADRAGAPASRTPSPDATVVAPTPAPSPSTDPASGGADLEDVVARTRFAGRISEVPGAIRREMRGTTWRPGCPVPIDELRLLRFNYWGLDGDLKRGPMVVNVMVAEDVLWVFERLYDAGFPMKRVGLTREFVPERWEDDPNTRRSVTASFNCRVVVTPDGPGDDFSQHAYGLAVDVNPLLNPYVRADGWVHNRFARPFVDRSRRVPGMIHEGDVVVRAFAEIGWAWGGRWSGGKDYMHFSLAGR